MPYLGVLDIFFFLKKKKRFNFKHIFHPAAAAAGGERWELAIYADDQGACLQGKVSVARRGVQNFNFNSPISILISHPQEHVEVGARGIPLAPLRRFADFSWEARIECLHREGSVSLLGHLGIQAHVQCLTV